MRAVLALPTQHRWDTGACLRTVMENESMSYGLHDIQYRGGERSVESFVAATWLYLILIVTARTSRHLFLLPLLLLLQPLLLCCYNNCCLPCCILVCCKRA